jgi:hypothetical protein
VRRNFRIANTFDVRTIRGLRVFCLK